MTEINRGLYVRGRLLCKTLRITFLIENSIDTIVC